MSSTVRTTGWYSARKNPVYSSENLAMWHHQSHAEWSQDVYSATPQKPLGYAASRATRVPHAQACGERSFPSHSSTLMIQRMSVSVRHRRVWVVISLAALAVSMLLPAVAAR